MEQKNIVSVNTNQKIQVNMDSEAQDEQPPSKMYGLKKGSLYSRLSFLHVGWGWPNLILCSGSKGERYFIIPSINCLLHK